MDLQEIYLEPNQDGSSFALAKSHIQVHTCRTYETARDSGNVKSTALVDYRWEVKLYHGNLVVMHKNCDALAYILHGAPSRNGCAVRVYSRTTKNRALIKQFHGQVVDLAWAFTTNPLYLAIVDEGGNLYIYLVKLESTEIATFPPQRVVWCPYVAEEANGDDSSMSGSGDNETSTAGGSLKSCGLLAVAYGDKVDVLDLEPLIEARGHEVEMESLTETGCFATFTTRGTILSITLSPDATALAVATEKGEVIFYIMESLNDIREAHHWSPHKSHPVTTIMFLDDVTDSGKDVHFWKFALTAADDNRELKLWNCETWECFSTLRIEPPNAHMEHISLIITMDWTANYLFLSDIERKSLYVVQMSKNNDVAKFVSFSEFPLVQPALSLAIVEASRKRFRPFSPNACADLDRSDDGEDDGNKINGVRASLYAVNPKSLLELEMRFQPNVADLSDTRLSSTSSLKLDSFRDELSDLSSADVIPPPPSEIAKVADDFARNSKKIQPIIASSPSDSATPVHRTPTKDVDNDRQVSNSPSSQEVRTILSHSGGTINDDETFTTGSNVENLERPTTPVANTLYLSSSDAQTPAGGGSIPSVGALCDAVSKLSVQVERMVAHLQRQEDELLQLKTALNGQNDLIQSMASVVQTAEQQVKSGEETLRNCQSHVQSFRGDQFRQNLNQTMSETVQRNLDAIVKNEMKTTVACSINETMNKLKDVMQNELTQKMSATDALLRENIGKMVKSKPIVEAIGQSAGQAIANEAHAAYKQAFQSVVVPSFESASRNLFTQMNEIFRKGTTDYLEQLQRQLTTARAGNDELKSSIVVHMTEVSEQMRVAFEKQSTALCAQLQQTIETRVQQSTSKANDALLQSVRQIVKDELSRSMADTQQAWNDTVLRVLRSQAPTPAPSSPHIDRQQVQKELSILLQQNNYGVAFQRALDAQDVVLLMHVCSKVQPTQIFSMSPCPLTQPVILSLVQQLSVDLSTQTELKIKYLQEAIPSIDPKAPGTSSQNLNMVITQLQQSFNKFLQNRTSDPYARQIKLLTMSAQSLLS